MSRHISYYHKPRTSALQYKLLHEFLDECAAADPTKEAVIFYDKNNQRTSLSYTQYREHSQCLAASLLNIGFYKGDRVLLVATNGLEYPVCMMALSRIGACALLMTSHGRTELNEELVEQLRKWNVRGVICTPGVRGRVTEGIRDLLSKLAGSGQLKGVVVIEGNENNLLTSNEVIEYAVYSYKKLISQENMIAKSSLSRIKLDPDDPAFVTFTSGTTGVPKATLISSHALVNGHNLEMGVANASLFHWKPMSVSSFLPVFALGVIKGHTIVSMPHDIMTSVANLEFIFSVVTAEKCSSVSLPLHLIPKLLQNEPHAKQLHPNAKTFGFGGQFVPRKAISSLLQRFPGKAATYLYATTETFMIGVQFFSNQSVNQKDYGLLTIVPDVEVKVVDEVDEVVAMGTKGQILVRGPRTFVGYLDDGMGTYRAITPAGWVRTGDYGFMPAYGKLKLLGRKTHIIRRVIEAFPSSHKKVAFATKERRIVSEHSPDTRENGDAGTTEHLRAPIEYNSTTADTTSGKMENSIYNNNDKELESTNSAHSRTVEIFPSQVEDILQDHPQIFSACAVGIPSGNGHELLYACVVPVSGCNMKSRLKELEAWCETQFSGTHSRPDKILVLGELPVAPSLKIDRQAIREMIIEQKL